MAEAGTVSVGIEPMMDGFKEALSGNIFQSVGDVGDAAGDLLGKAITTAVPFAAAVGATDMIKQSVDATSEYGETLEKVSTMTGETADQSARLLAGFGGAGISASAAAPMIEMMNMRLGRLAQSADSATTGGNTATRLFQTLGISLKDAAGNAIPMNTLMPEIIDKLNGISDPTQRAALASQLFGRNYAQLAPLLARGGEGFKEAEADADKYGLTIGEDGVEKTAKYHEAQEQLSEAVLGLQVNLGERLLPAITSIIGGVANLAGAFNSLSGPFRMLQPFVPVILAIVGAIAALNTIMLLNSAISAANEAILAARESISTAVTIATGLQAVANGDLTLTEWAMAAGGYAAAAAELAMLWPIALIVAAIIALIVVVVLIITHWQTVHQWLTNVWTLMQQAAAWIAGVFVATWNTVSSAVQNFLTAVASVMAAIPGVVTGALGAALGAVLAWAGNMVAQAFSAGARFLSGVAGGLAAVPGVVAGALGAALGAVFSWGGSMAGAARSAAYNAAAAVPGAFAALPGEMVSIGAQIISGMISGIQSAVGGLASAAASAAGSALNAAKSALGISSPSRVMAEEVGGPMAEGMVQGFQNGVTTGLKGLQIPAMQAAVPVAGGAAAGGPVVAINNPTFKDEADVEVLMRKVEAAVSAQKF